MQADVILKEPPPMGAPLYAPAPIVYFLKEITTSGEIETT